MRRRYHVRYMDAIDRPNSQWVIAESDEEALAAVPNSTEILAVTDTWGGE